MAHNKGGATTRKNRDSAGRRLGVKLFGGQSADVGNIILRQRGTRFYPGIGTDIGKDHTIFAKTKGTVKFKKLRGRNFITVN